jgi:hypothetical protein
MMKRVGSVEESFFKAANLLFSGSGEGVIFLAAIDGERAKP